VRSGRDKATFVLDPDLATMGLWIEQLVAESLGKDGTGAVPIVGEPVGEPHSYGDDRVFLSQVRVDELAAAGHPALVGGSDASPHGIGHLAVTMELAVALTGAAIGVQPFDQPDVAAAKAATSEVLRGGDVSVPVQPLAELLDAVQPGDHLALQVFADPGDHQADVLDVVRTVLRDRLGVAVSLGFGPRFLHSTGQLHKGGPDTGVFLQLTADPAADLRIGSWEESFGTLIAAQALGDLQSLQRRGRRALRLHFADHVRGLDWLQSTIDAALA
jgi:transaldolase / glucose-6-phosphate isomerase